jgi:hypothetical protein
MDVVHREKHVFFLGTIVKFPMRDRGAKQLRNGADFGHQGQCDAHCATASWRKIEGRISIASLTIAHQHRSRIESSTTTWQQEKN